MRILLDSNILIRLINVNDSEHVLVQQSVERLSLDGHELLMVPQGLYELWAVVTRPSGAPNGLNFTPGQAAGAVSELTATFLLLPDTPQVFERWFALVVEHQVSGRNSHDTRMAAACLADGLDAFLTLNTPDFKRFGLSVLHPATL